MLGGLKLKRDLSTWLGLIDGVYSVAMTLLITSLPETTRRVFSSVQSCTHSLPVATYFKIPLNLPFLHGSILVVTMFCVFLITVDSWSIERRQLEHAPVIDKSQCLLLISSLFCSVLLPTIFLLRFERSCFCNCSSNTQYLDWLIALLFCLEYGCLYQVESRIASYYTQKGVFRQARVSRFSLLAIRKRLACVLFLPLFFFFAMHSLHVFFVSAFYPILLSIIVLDNRFFSISLSACQKFFSFNVQR